MFKAVGEHSSGLGELYVFQRYPVSIPLQFIGQTILAGQQVPLPKFSALLPTFDTTGDFEEMYLVASESAGLVKDIKPAGQIVREMMDEAGQIIEHRLT